MSGHFSSLQTQHSELLQTVQEQKNLIGQLETDLLRAQPYIQQRTEGEVHLYIYTYTHVYTGMSRTSL